MFGKIIGKTINYPFKVFRVIANSDNVDIIHEEGLLHFYHGGRIWNPPPTEEILDSFLTEGTEARVTRGMGNEFSHRGTER